MRGNLPPSSPGTFRRTLAICSGSQGENRRRRPPSDHESPEPKAAGVGFEPTEPCHGLGDFQDRLRTADLQVFCRRFASLFACNEPRPLGGYSPIGTRRRGCGRRAGSRLGARGHVSNCASRRSYQPLVFSSRSNLKPPTRGGVMPRFTTVTTIALVAALATGRPAQRAGERERELHRAPCRPHRSRPGGGARPGRVYGCAESGAVLRSGPRRVRERVESRSAGRAPRLTRRDAAAARRARRRPARLIRLWKRIAQRLHGGPA